MPIEGDLKVNAVQPRPLPDLARSEGYTPLGLNLLNELSHVWAFHGLDLLRRVRLACRSIQLMYAFAVLLYTGSDMQRAGIVPSARGLTAQAGQQEQLLEFSDRFAAEVAVDL